MTPLTPEQRDLVERHRGIAYNIARRMLPTESYEDKVQDGMVGLIDAVQKYRPDGGSFRTYAQHRVRGAIMDAHRTRYHTKRKRKEWGTVSSIDATMEQIAEKMVRVGQNGRGVDDAMPWLAEEGFEDDLIGKLHREDGVRLLREVMASMSPRDRAVIHAGLTRTRSRLAEQWGCDPTYVSQLQRGIYGRLRNVLRTWEAA